ncbi:MAG: Rep [Methylocystaceae bacterium]|nr:MAG: Rep [Methylocystaceae bacterium]
MAARSGRPFRRLKAKCGLLGVVTVIDLTHGPNGWHVHAHAVVIAGTAAGALASASALEGGYLRALTKSGVAVSDTAARVRSVYDPQGMARYFSKSWRLPAKGREETPLNLLERALSGSLEAFELFLEAVEAFRGKKRGVVSPALSRALWR